ncbi:MAG: hypothetical protein JW983_05855, partial [Elusimicrobia bacterium]|nr:hypothetical protein [Elusimicrobiota bacterium]
AKFQEIGEMLNKLRKYYGKIIKYGILKKLLKFYKYDENKIYLLIRYLYDKKYLIGYDCEEKKVIPDVNLFLSELKKKKFFILNNNPYIIINVKCYEVKERQLINY